MKKLSFLFIFLLGFIYSQNAFSQVQDHTKEFFSLSKKEVKVGETIDIIIKIDISKDWYIYAIEKDEAVMAYEAGLALDENTSFQTVGSFKAVNPKKKYDEIWPGNYTYFEKKAEFRQTIKILKKDFKVSGDYSHQTCSNITGQCLPPETQSFSFSTKDVKILEAKADKPEEEKTEENGKDDKEESNKENEGDEENASEIEEDSDKESEEAFVNSSENNDNNDVNVEKSAGDDTVTSQNYEMSITEIIAASVLGGILAFLMPCIFPIVPMTVTFFLKQSKNRADGIKKATFYGLSIIGIFMILGIVLSAVFGVTFANKLSTSWFMNILFFLIFVIFGMSLLGMFELVLPSSWVSKADSKADKGGYLGIFFMAFVLVLVSFSCTLPIVGYVLVQSAQGGFTKPIIAMFFFSATLALPFTLFAMFPSMLKSMPKSGGWLNAIKVVFGFIELALSLKFLSVADQVYHWGILDRNIYIAFWIVIFSMIGFYLLGKIRMPHDSPVEKVSVPRAIFAIMAFSFVVYLVPGMFGAPLKSLAGYLPPQSTMEFDLVTNKEVEQIVERKLKTVNLNVANNENKKQDSKIGGIEVKYADKLHLPHGLKGFFDYEQAVAYAKKVNKPIFIDFTGHGCVNCREMEQSVWSEPEVLKRLEEDFVLVALYVDERTNLPKKEWYESKFDGSTIKTVGDLNADIQITRFNNNAQPYYCIINPKGKLLAEPKAFDKNIENFVDFLDKAVENFTTGKTTKNGNLAKN